MYIYTHICRNFSKCVVSYIQSSMYACMCVHVRMCVCVVSTNTLTYTY